MIHILSKETIDKIAAGEVVERPESVVRELLDNAVDAGADSISVEIRGGGLELIRITDNGSGIDKGDVPVAFIRHATSKLQTAEDIAHVSTMGFRGEALASIAAVSRTELISKTREDMTGLLYRVEFGKETRRSEVGAPDGTTVTVRDFLQNVPVRRQFLRSSSVETAAMIDIVEKNAIAHPEISFSLTADHRNLLRTSGNGRLKDVLYLIYGADVTRHLLEITQTEEEEIAGGSVAGFIGKPVLNRSKRDYEVFFVNGRHIHSELLQKAAEDAFAPYMMQHRFPLAIFNVKLPPEAVDVNIHPRKTEVRFCDSRMVYDLVLHAIRDTLEKEEHVIEALDSAAPLPEARHAFRISAEETAAAVPEEREPESPEPFETRRTFDYVSTIQEEIEKKAPEYAHTETKEDHSPSGAFLLREETDTRAVYGAENVSGNEKRFLEKENMPYFKLIGQVFETYWIIEYGDDMYLIDQHAAHEKVNYERYMKLIRSHGVTSQQIFPPKVLTLTAGEAALTEKFLPEFAAAGYDIEPAGDRDFIVRAVPSNLPSLAEEELLKDMISGLFEEASGLRSEMLQDKIASMSCKAAVKGNRHLSEPEMRVLIGELLQLDNPYACPHGRPTIAKWSKYELDKIFKRVVS